jgi:hypothetical protein
MATVTTLPRGKRAASIEIHLDRHDADGGRAVEMAADALGACLAAAALRFADRRAAAGQAITAAELDRIATQAVRRVLASCGHSLSAARTSGAVLIRTAVNSRGQAPRRSAGTGVTVVNALPEFIEVETQATYDKSGRMTGTRTIKQRAT